MKNKNITFKIFKQNETYYFQNIELSIFHHSNNLQEGYNFCQQKAVENLGSYDSAKTLIKYQKNGTRPVCKTG